MKASDRAVLIGLGIAGLLAAFWFLVLAPKREEASKLGDDVAALQDSVDQANQEVAVAEEARKGFDSDYRQLVVLGKAVPADDDTPSLMAELQRISARSGVDFRSIALSDDTGSASSIATTTSTTSTSTTTTDSSTTDSSESSTDTTASSASSDSASSTAITAPLPTEATAATLPIGATIGSAGLPVMPYNLEFNGDFFDIADFFGQVDGLVHTQGTVLGVNGRLLTINGFDLTADANKGFPHLTASVAATSFVTPATQGLVAGASPSGPAPTTTEPTPTSTATSDSSSSLPAATATP
jgi:Tfp pilus assembly protein PilO